MKYGIDMAAAFPVATARKIERAADKLMGRCRAAQQADNPDFAGHLALEAQCLVTKAQIILETERAA